MAASNFMKPAIQDINFEGFISAKVMSIDKEDNSILAYIPKVMSCINMYSDVKVNTITLDKHSVINREMLSFDNTIKTMNCIKLFPMYNNSNYIPKVGSDIIVLFIDGDPQKGYYLPFSLNREIGVI